MAGLVVHISEPEAAKDFATVLARVREGAEVVIEREGDGRAIAVVRPVERPGRLLSESIALAKEHERELGYSPTLDPDFAADLEEIIKRRQVRDRDD